MDILQNGIGYVVLTLDDDSIKVLKTTLNQKILLTYGVTAKTGSFFDLETLSFYDFRNDVKTIEIYKDKPKFEKELINFVNRFI